MSCVADGWGRVLGAPRLGIQVKVVDLQGSQETGLLWYIVSEEATGEINLFAFAQVSKPKQINITNDCIVSPVVMIENIAHMFHIAKRGRAHEKNSPVIL